LHRSNLSRPLPNSVSQHLYIRNAMNDPHRYVLGVTELQERSKLIVPRKGAIHNDAETEAELLLCEEQCLPVGQLPGV
jgi:hypothetical protein